MTDLLRVLCAACAFAAIALTGSFAEDSSVNSTRRLDPFPIPKGIIPVAMCGVDLLGIDLTPMRGLPELCPLTCHAFPLCDGVTWTNHNGGTCWLKLVNQYAFIATTVPKAGAISFVLLPVALDIPVRSYEGVDFFGDDLANQPARTGTVCEIFCVTNPQCFAWTWTNYNGGTCWLKGRVTNFVHKAGAWSGYVAHTAQRGLVSRTCQ